MIDKKRLKKAKDVINKLPEHHDYDIEHELHMHETKKTLRHKILIIALTVLFALGAVWFAITHNYLAPMWYDNVLVQTIVEIHRSLAKE